MQHSFLCTETTHSHRFVTVTSLLHPLLEASYPSWVYKPLINHSGVSVPYKERLHSGALLHQPISCLLAPAGLPDVHI